MTESSPTAVFYGSAKAEQVNPPKKESKFVSGVRKAIESWIERIGPKSVEKHFVKAHENVLATLNSDQRKEVFAKEAEKWRKWGKTIGITATVVDTGLSALGFGLAFTGIKNPNIGAQIYLDIVKKSFALSLADNPNMTPGAVLSLINNKYIDTPGITDSTTTTEFINGLQLNPATMRERGLQMAFIPGIASITSTLGIGPAHMLAHIAGFSAEQVGKMKARTHNYVDSGKAAEHAKAVGKTLGDAAKSTVKYVAEHPDEIRKTVESVNRVKRQNAESTQKLKETQQKAADIALEKEYQDWISHHPDKTYYEQSGHPYPSKADYVAKKNEEEAKRKANKEAEARGVAKDSPKK